MPDERRGRGGRGRTQSEEGREIIALVTIKRRQWTGDPALEPEVPSQPILSEAAGSLGRLELLDLCVISARMMHF